MTGLSEIRRTYIDIDKNTPCMIYEPLHPGQKAKTGLVCIHSDDSYFEFSPVRALSARGYRIITSSFPDRSISLDEKVRHVDRVLKYLKEYPGIEKVILLGHSGGATLMSCYQMVAENGSGAFQGPEKIIPMEELDGLNPADAVIFLDSNFGNGVMTLLSLDPAVTKEGDGVHLDPTLNMYLPENGYDPKGCHFSDEFIHRYWAGQAERMNHLIDYAREKAEEISNGQGTFYDDMPLFIVGGTQFKPMNKIFPQMPGRFFSHTKGKWPLLHKDGSITIDVVPCLRTVFPGMQFTGNYWNGCLRTTVKSFLRSCAVRVNPRTFGYDETSLSGIEWDSSYCTTVSNAAHISAPMLIMGMTGSYEYIASEHIFNRAVKCTDKTMAFVEGAGHNFEAEHEAEKAPGEFGDTEKLTFDYVDKWIEERF